MAEKIFGHTITNSDGREVMVRYIGEQHVQEDLGRIPSINDWFRQIEVQSWMYGSRKSLEKELAGADSETEKESARDGTAEVNLLG